MEEIKLIINPFEMGTEKEAALKPLEEAAEVYAAWQEIDGCGSPEKYCPNCEVNDICCGSRPLADEIADVIQASCNLAARYSIDLQAAMERCERRNRERGRYGDAKPCGIHDGDNRGCGWSCGAVPVGMDVLREKTPEEMSFKELFETLSFAIDNHSSVSDCRKIIGLKWCEGNYDCRTCRQRLLDLLKAAHERQIDDLAHERDGLRRRLAELSDAGITEMHKLLRETLGEAKNITHNARVYINKKQESKDEHCGSRGSVWRNHGGDCGAQCAREHLLPAEPPAQEMSEREKVVERLRGYDVYMTETPSKNASRLFACITGNKDAEIACGNDIEAVRDKLIGLIGGVNDAK